MGFELELLLLYPSTVGLALEDQPFDEPVKHTWRKLWTGEESIDFGRCTRMEKMTNYPHLTFAGRERAAVSMASVVLGRLFEQLAKEPRSVLANPILVYEDYATNDLYGPDERPSIDVGSCSTDYFTRRSLRRERIEGHNRIIDYDDAKLKAELENYFPVLDPPYLWERCETVAQWLEEAETQSVLEWTEVAKDPVSLAIYRARRAYLREIAKIDVRVLFLYS